MSMRIARGVSAAIAVGLVMAGGVAQADVSTTPTVKVGFKSGPEAPFGFTRFDGARVGDRVYFLGGRLQDNSTDGSIWYYDIKKKKYTDTKDDMAVPISNYTVAVLKDKTGTGLYTFGGRNNDGESVTTVQVYYPDSGKTAVLKKDKWPGMTPSDCVSLPATGVAVTGGKAYVVGGMSFSTSVPPCVDDNSKEVWSFDPMAKEGKRWSKEPSLKTARGYIATAVVGDTIYAMGGDVNDAGTLTASDAVETWKIGSKKWESGPKLSEPCDETQAFYFKKGELGGTITLAGCGQWPSALPDVVQLDVKKGKWSTVGQLNEARRNHAGENIGSAKKPQLFVLGGYNGDGSSVLTTSEIGTAGKSTGPASAPSAGLPTTGGHLAF